MVKGKIRVLVYGSLKYGHTLHPVLSSGKNVEFVDRDYIEDNLVMVDMGAFPALVDDNAVHRVYGELYTIDDETLAALDYAEGHPLFYKRRKVRTKGQDVKAWVYVLTDAAAEYTETVIPKGVWQPSDKEAHYVKSVEESL